MARRLPRRPGTQLGTALQPPFVWWCSSREAEVCSYRQLGSASASPPSPMVFLVLEEKVHSLRDVTLLSRDWNINSDANWKWTAFYVLWNEAICNPRIGSKRLITNSMLLSPDKTVTKHQDNLNTMECRKHLNGLEGRNNYSWTSWMVVCITCQPW